MTVYDLAGNRSTEVFPPTNDLLRREYSRWIRPLISVKWCEQANAQCDPSNFDTGLTGPVVVNEAARVFGFEARFDAAGFGPEAEKRLADRHVVYIFRERAGKWEHREFDARELGRRFGVSSIGDLVTRRPAAPFVDRPK